MLEPPVLHVFSEVPCQILMFFGGSMSEPPVLHVFSEVPCQNFQL